MIGPIWPDPGSDAALRLGCECPVLDNGHGYGYMGTVGVFAYNLECPLHGPELTAATLTQLDLEPLGKASRCTCFRGIGAVDAACPVHGQAMFAELNEAIDAVEREHE